MLEIIKNELTDNLRHSVHQLQRAQPPDQLSLLIQPTGSPSLAVEKESPGAPSSLSHNLVVPKQGAYMWNTLPGMQTAI